MANQPHKGLRRIINAAGYSRQGLAAAWRHEEAFRQELLLCLVLVPLALWLGETGLERAVMVGVLVGPPAASYRVRKFVRRNRGVVIGSAAVFVALWNVVIVWGIILFT